MPKHRQSPLRIDGDVEKLTQIAKVEGNVIINSSSTPNATALLARGVQLVRRRAYEQAIITLSSAINADPEMAPAYYYHAVASLRGHRPKILTLTQAEEIEQDLLQACSLDDNKIQYFSLWAILKFDFFVTNGFLIHPPSIEDLILAAKQCPSDSVAMAEMLEHIPGTDHRIVSILRRK